MSYVQPIQSSTEFKTKDVDVDENIRTLANSGAVFRMGDSSINDPTASNLSTLLRRVSGNSTREIDTLIGDLGDLREKLHSDGDRIHREIVEYAALSQQCNSVGSFPKASKDCRMPLTRRAKAGGTILPKGRAGSGHDGGLRVRPLWAGSGHLPCEKARHGYRAME